MTNEKTMEILKTAEQLMKLLRDNGFDLFVTAKLKASSSEPEIVIHIQPTKES